MIVFFPIHAIGVEPSSVIDKVKNAVSAVTEAKEINQKSLKSYDGNLIDDINRSVEQFEFNEYSNSARNFSNDNYSGFSLNTGVGNVEPNSRDPFNLSGQASRKRSGGFGSSFLPSLNNNNIPTLKLRGVIHPHSDKPGELLALLEVGNNDVHMVRVGDEISYDPRDPNAAIKIIDINRLTVTVQAGSLGNVLIVR